MVPMTKMTLGIGERRGQTGRVAQPSDGKPHSGCPILRGFSRRWAATLLIRYCSSWSSPDRGRVVRRVTRPRFAWAWSLTFLTQTIRDRNTLTYNPSRATITVWLGQLRGPSGKTALEAAPKTFSALFDNLS